jgi:hypothetical protein
MFDLCPNCKAETPISSYRHKVDDYISYYLVNCHKCGNLWHHEWILPHTFVNKLQKRKTPSKQHGYQNFVRVLGNSNMEVKKPVAVASLSVILVALATFALVPSLQYQYVIGQPSSPFLESSPFAESPTETVSGDTGEDPLRIGMLVFGIENDTGNIVTFATVNNITKAGADSASVLDLADNSTDGIGEVYYSFPEISTEVGDEFEACALKVSDQSIQCTSGFKSPGNRTEVAQLLVG